MKKVIFVFLIILFVGCSNEEIRKGGTSWDKINIPKEKNYYDSNGSLLEKIVYNGKIEGMLDKKVIVEGKIIDYKKKEIGKIRNSYSMENKILEEKMFDRAGEVIKNIKYIYSKDGKLISKTIIGKNYKLENVYSGDNGLDIKKTGKNGGDLILNIREEKYDLKGNLIKDYYEDNNGNLLLGYDYKYKYDLKGRLVEKIITRNDGFEFNQSYETELNRDEKVTSIAEYDSDGRVKKYTEYAYDDLGKLSSKIIKDELEEIKEKEDYDLNGNISNKIFYYQDGSKIYEIHKEYDDKNRIVLEDKKDSKGNKILTITYIY
ncbi:RHS repeat domain-containing protein [Haliovirga abyssi]|uniref:Toxin-antitoxin system YwqK family antitoxin n=1 Tax=Haliovirga abyssi TaxID=2996794 RepID=A0AAU9DMV7_9FUSO|nr:hypothetical protein [Haliovirga abyssi]BDU49648.1 hypothetical protein HLVA_02170 [Haliovirga abyssi]